MYNLGVARLYGYGVQARDPVAAAAWFEKSTLPEGYFATAVTHLVSNVSFGACRRRTPMGWCGPERGIGRACARRVFRVYSD